MPRSNGTFLENDTQFYINWFQHFKELSVKYEVKLIEGIEVIANNKEAINFKKIDSGSYAVVYLIESKDGPDYAIKKAHNDLSKEEKERFKTNFNVLESLSHPNILKVFKYDVHKISCSMEKCDMTLKKYIDINNGSLTKKNRINICRKLISAFKCLEKMNILHRDISFTNILINKYDDVDIKISDFGLVKEEESILTKTNTNVKGSLNMKGELLRAKGFKNYNFSNEISALGYVLNYVLTGKKEDSNNILKICSGELLKRPKNIDELIIILKNQIDTIK